MADIKFKRSAVQGKIPITTDLELGQLAINTYDGKLFLKRDDGLQEYIVEVGGNVGFEVKNQTGFTIPKGTLVKFTGSLGASGRLLVAPFLANGTDPSEYVVGITENDIVDGADGFAIDHGKIFNLDTSAFSQGAILYASPIVAGGLTPTRPAAPNNKITVAAVVHSSTTVGILEVRLVVGSSLENDEIVELASLTQGDTLVWNAANGRFENAQPSSGSMVYPGAGLAVSTGTGWDTSKTSPTGDVVGTTDTQTLTNKTAEKLVLNDGYTEEVFAITDGAAVNLDPNNGSIQTWVLGDNRTPGQVNWNAGQSITLMIDDGSTFAVTWTTLGVVWKSDGASAPSLNTTGFTVIVLWKVGTTIYGARVGDA